MLEVTAQHRTLLKFRISKNAKEFTQCFHWTSEGCAACTQSHSNTFTHSHDLA